MEVLLMKENVCFSGGAEGADTAWGKAATAAGHEIVHYVFEGIGRNHAYPRVYLNEAELGIANQYLLKANETLKRGSFPYNSEYVNKLLRRNYWQVKHSERVYAVAPLNPELTQVRGGTGWAVQMAIDLGIHEIFVFDTVSNEWWVYLHQFNRFTSFEDVKPSKPPAPCGCYTGIGSREITQSGLQAIKEIYG
jgi:hypothetical protein